MSKDLQSETRVNGYVTTGDIAGPSAATGAWVGGLFGLMAGSALLFVPGAGPLVVLGPLAAATVGVAHGALLGGGVGAVLGHFVAKEHIPKYCWLVVVDGAHGGAQSGHGVGGTGATANASVGSPWCRSASTASLVTMPGAATMRRPRRL